MAERFTVRLDELRYSPTAALFEGKTAGVGISSFVVQSPVGGFVELHTHPYAETFFLLRGHGRWTAGDTVIEAEAEQVIAVPAGTPHGFRNVGDEPLLVLSVHESPELIQSAFGDPPA